jgi:hypothetical protein
MTCLEKDQISPPLPWAYVRSSDRFSNKYDIYGSPSGDGREYPVAYDLELTLAQYICHSANTFHQMLAALEAIIIAEFGTDYLVHPQTYDSKLWTRAAEAISAAKGEA